MSDPQFISGLSDIHDQYDAILCDVWGVIHNGRRAYDAACEALTSFRETGKPVVLITNAPVPKAQVISYFRPMGVPDSAFDDCVSSGDATRAELEKRRDEKVFLFGVDEGWERDRFLYEGLDLDFVSLDEATTVLCIGLEDQANEHPEDYRDRLKALAERKLSMICANPDIKVRVGDQLVWCAGALAAIYEELGGPVIYPGKPHAAIYDLALKRLAALGVEPAQPRLLCIGDSPATDMKGANDRGFHALYTGTGLKDHGDDFEGEVRELLASYDQAAHYAMPALKW